MTNIFTHITAAAPTTTTITSRPCTLAGLVVNKATATGVITIYNGTAAQADVVAIITEPGTLLQDHLVVDYKDVILDKGLTVVTSGAAQDITVMHRPSA